MSALYDDGKGETAPAGAPYIYYRLYVKEGPLESKNPLYSNDLFISCISSRLVRPPHTAALLKKYLCKVEGLKGVENCTLYQSLSEQVALEDSTRLLFRGKPGPGSSDLNPMALVAETSIAENRLQAANTGDPQKLLERDYEQRYVYYRLYDEDGGVVPKTSFSEHNPFLGRVNTLSIPPPYKMSSLKCHLIKSEQISGQDVQIFQDEDSESTMDDGDPLSLLADDFPGSLEDRPVAVVYESEGRISSLNDEDPNEIQARELREARSALDASQKSNEKYVSELDEVRKELEKAKETHTRELREKTTALGRLEEEKKSNEAAFMEGASPAQVKALSERPDFRKRLKAATSYSSRDPKWHSMAIGDVFYTDGVIRSEHWSGFDGEWRGYLAISPSGKLAFAYHPYLAFA